MSQGGYVTLVGFVAREPVLRETKNKTLVADVRVGTTARYLNRSTGEWVDGETCYYTVNCWRGLAGNVRASLHKGDPVIVRGKFRTRTYTDREGTQKTEAEIVAETIGHDLSRGAANFLRQPRQRPEAADELVAGELARASTKPDEDDPGDDPVLPDGDLPPFPDSGSGVDPGPFNEEAVANYSRKLDDDDAMARELRESEEAAMPAAPH
jgi:single-strand DNA-binding protein